MVWPRAFKNQRLALAPLTAERTEPSPSPQLVLLSSGRGEQQPGSFLLLLHPSLAAVVLSRGPWREPQDPPSRPGSALGTGSHSGQGQGLQQWVGVLPAAEGGGAGWVWQEQSRWLPSAPMGSHGFLPSTSSCLSGRDPAAYSQEAPPLCKGPEFRGAGDSHRPGCSPSVPFADLSISGRASQERRTPPFSMVFFF